MTVPHPPNPPGIAPLVLFVHVPKTAGSTVNHHLAQSGIPGVAHVERWIDDPGQAQSRIGGLGWISGHVSLPGMQRLAALARRQARLFTLIRKPGAQVASHYNWLVEIFHRGESFYNGHPPRIREISERIRSSDNSDPRAIIDNLQRHAGLFLNQQSRTMIGEDVVALSQAAIGERLATYAHVARDGGIATLLQAMTGQAPHPVARVNRSTWHLDPGIFRTPALQEFLACENALDRALHERLALAPPHE